MDPRRSVGAQWVGADAATKAPQREDKYKARSFIDTFVYRAGDQIGAWSYSLLTWLGLGLAGISFAAAPLATIWCMISIWLGSRSQWRASGNHESPASCCETMRACPVPWISGGSQRARRWKCWDDCSYRCGATGTGRPFASKPLRTFIFRRDHVARSRWRPGAGPRAPV